MSSESPAPYRNASGNATLALILGIVGLVGGLGSCCCCLFTVLALCSPVAWFVGHKELGAIRAGASSPVGESSAKAGMIMGMIGTGILVLYLIGIVIYVAMVGVGVATETLKHGPPLPR